MVDRMREQKINGINGDGGIQRKYFGEGAKKGKKNNNECCTIQK